jgi:hypothetical protein
MSYGYHAGTVTQVILLCSRRSWWRREHAERARIVLLSRPDKVIHRTQTLPSMH